MVSRPSLQQQVFDTYLLGAELASFMSSEFDNGFS